MKSRMNEGKFVFSNTAPQYALTVRAEAKLAEAIIKKSGESYKHLEFQYSDVPLTQGYTLAVCDGINQWTAIQLTNEINLAVIKYRELIS